MSMLLGALDDMVIKRFNKDKEAQDQIAVRILYTPKQRVISDLLDKAQNLQLPACAISVGGVTRDPQRVFNKIQGSNYNIDNLSYYGNLSQPIPVDIVANLSILARYQKDMDQILSNFIPYFDPYIVLSWTIPAMPNQEIRSQVFWNGTVNITYPVELVNTQKQVVAGDTSFTIKGWLFKHIPEQGDAKIYTIHTDYYMLSSLTSQYMEMSAGGMELETAVISAIPQPRDAFPHYIRVNTSGQSLEVWGKSFLQIQNIFLSGSSYLSGSQTYNPLLTSKNLSALYSEITALRIDPTLYSNYTDTYINISLPPATDGVFDVIIQNEAGMNSLVAGAIARYSNYPDLSSRYPEFSQGIQVV